MILFSLSPLFECRRNIAIVNLIFNFSYPGNFLNLNNSKMENLFLNNFRLHVFFSKIVREMAVNLVLTKVEQTWIING